MKLNNNFNCKKLEISIYSSTHLTHGIQCLFLDKGINFGKVQKISSDVLKKLYISSIIFLLHSLTSDKWTA
jgi:hypothetical protein